MNPKGGPEDNQEGFFDKEEDEIYKIITGKIKYSRSPWREDELKPDLIMKIKIPQQAYISRNSYLSLSNFITAPSQRLERCYSRAEKQITRDMEENHENIDPHNIKIRMQLALKTIDPTVKATSLINDVEEEEVMEFECINSLSGVLDAFTIQFNTMVYTLQALCGFQVRGFVLYDKKVERREIYLFLRMRTENLLRVANKYRIKKEVEYPLIDFSLNDPTTRDDRPIKLNSKFKMDRHSVAQQKHIKRFFHVREGENKEVEIMKERDLDDAALENFRSCNQELHTIYEYIKYQQDGKLSNLEKAYIFEYNRRKINPGVAKIYDRIKKRREYFNISKEILPRYGYHVWEEPVVFEEFTLPDKNSKGATFFNKFESIMLYRPLVVSRGGDLSLFLNMERTKLSYLIVKVNFKVNYLSKIGVDIFTLDDPFEKFGGDEAEGLRGGIDGECLIEKWNPYSLFSDMKVLRNYMGERVAYEVLCVNDLFGYLISVLLPYCILFIIEQAFDGTSVYLGTTPIEAILYSISFCLYLAEMQSDESEFIKNYCDSVSSKIFLSKFRGPYQRNILTDEPNEFHTPSFGPLSILKNLACLLIMAAIFIVIGAIFYGFRMMLVEIYQPLSIYTLSGTLSLPHIIAYALFFLSECLLRIAIVKRVISGMVYLQNPSSDKHQQEMENSITFYYLLGVELIPPLFLLILEPFSDTSCYANKCEDELRYFIYSRFIVMISIVLVRLTYLMIFQYARRLKSLIKDEKKQELFFQEKLGGLLKSAVNNSKKPEHLEDMTTNIINLVSFSIYNTILPISPVIVCIAVFIHFTNLRISILYEERRPVNKSQSLQRFTGKIRFIYYIGIIFISWTSIILLEIVQLFMQPVVEKISTTISHNAIFLLKLVVTILYGWVLVLIGSGASTIIRAFSTNSLNARKDNKYKEYKTSRGGLKTILIKSEEIQPIKTIFRIFNPDRSSQEQLFEEVYRGINKEFFDNIGSAALLEKYSD